MGTEDTESQGTETGEDLSVEAILGFDAFEDSGKEQNAEGQDSGEQQTQGQDQDQGQDQGQEGQSATEDHTGEGDQNVSGEQTQSQAQDSAQEEDPKDAELRQLRETVSQMQQTMAQMQQGQQDQGQNAQGQGQGQSEGPDLSQFVPDYNFQVPNETQKLLQSDDPNEFQQGLMQVQQGYAQSVHYNLLQQMQQMYNTIEQRIPEVAQQTAQTQMTQQDIKQDYFSQYPHHQDPNIQPLLQQVSERVLQQNPQASWNQNLRDQIGQEVDRIIQSFAGQQPQNQNQAAPQSGGSQQPQGQNASSPAAPPQQVGTGTRPGSSGNNADNDVIATLLG